MKKKWMPSINLKYSMKRGMQLNKAEYQTNKDLKNLKNLNLILFSIKHGHVSPCAIYKRSSSRWISDISVDVNDIILSSWLSSLAAFLLRMNKIKSKIKKSYTNLNEKTYSTKLKCKI